MADTNAKPTCKYGEECYRRNESHLNSFSHPPKTKADKQTETPVTNNKHKASPPQPDTDTRKQARMDSPTVDENHVETSTKSPEKMQISEPEKISPKKSPTIEKSVESTQQLHCGYGIIAGNSRFDDGASLIPTEFIKNKFLVNMPDDFYALWDFCKETAVGEQAPESIFQKFGLQLVGPFDVLANKFKDAGHFQPGQYLRHWRFYYDPPEFQTIMVKGNTSLHYGYWRDSPDKACLISRNDESKGCEIAHVADNAFSTVIYYLDNDAQLTPFNRPAALAVKKSLEDFAQRRNIALDTFHSNSKARNNRAVCKTFHKAGLIVPYDRKTSVGYRPLIESDANLKKILKKITDAEGDSDMISTAIEQLQPLITAASIAVDEGDHGNSIELGMDLFCSGAKELHPILLQLLINGYAMIKKPQFIAILKSHLDDRKAGSNISILQKNTV